MPIKGVLFWLITGLLLGGMIAVRERSKIQLSSRNREAGFIYDL